ncbi:MAG: ABC transporter ATP-binding protein [Defluviitaleaceae bacterium]|nr:ABC transporter ATP-binding protein [Defluviitaleaceae bacterium]MCL2835835.1 ABC transporter ATP-binding protein [Defluviitaleaceae bacterium]
MGEEAGISSEKLLVINNLQTSFRIDGKFYAAVDGVNLSINKNEVFAIVGESGCGKSAMALSVVKLHNANYTRLSGEIFFQGQDILKLKPHELNEVRGKGIGMIFQDPLTALNPLHRVGIQIEESLVYHTNLDKAGRKERAMELLTNVGMVDPELAYRLFPHELSGGMRQRAMIAIAISAKPDLLIADEPTTALDVTIQAQILDLLRDLRKETGSSMILITHDLGVVAEMADRVAVMYAGQIVETAPVAEIFQNPLHPYTRSLLNSIPSADSDEDWDEKRLQTIQGMVPGLKDLPRTGCRFSHRVPWINQSDHQEHPVYHEADPGHFVLCSCYKTFKFDSV